MTWTDQWKRTRKTLLKALSIGALLVMVSLGLAHRDAAAQNTQTPPKAAGNVENGKRLYASNRCWECHDNEAQGGNGPRIGPTPLPLTAFTAYLRQPKGQMPPYIAKVVSDAEVADIYAYLESLPKPPSANSIPLLNEHLGK